MPRGIWGDPDARFSDTYNLTEGGTKILQKSMKLFTVPSRGFGEKKDVISKKQMQKTNLASKGNRVDQSITNSLFQANRQPF